MAITLVWKKIRFHWFHKNQNKTQFYKWKQKLVTYNEDDIYKRWKDTIVKKWQKFDEKFMHFVYIYVGVCMCVCILDKGNLMPPFHPNVI
jgi:hypothetical protein